MSVQPGQFNITDLQRRADYDIQLQFKTELQAPNLKLAVAAVLSSKNNGTIFVRWTTGSRLQDLHDVEANGTKVDKDTLSWNAAANRWEPTDRLTLLEARVAALENP